MKNQYFGDVNDYRKYGLIRLLQRQGGLKTLIGWMLTADDGRSDGKFTEYLGDHSRWSRFDPELYAQLRSWVGDGGVRSVGLIERSRLLGNTRYFSEIVPDTLLERRRYHRRLMRAAEGHQLVFLDPDNGLEVKSRPLGSKDSSKYLFRHEARELFDRGHSLLIYQHFPRIERGAFIKRTAGGLATEIGVPNVFTFRTPHVLFLLIPQPRDERQLRVASEHVRERWGSELEIGMVSRDGDASGGLA